MNWQNMTPWRMFWMVVGLVLFMRLIGVVDEWSWVVMGIGLFALLGAMIVMSVPTSAQSRAGGMVATAILVWSLVQLSPLFWSHLSQQTTDALVNRGIQTRNRVAEAIDPEGEVAESERSAFCSREEDRITSEQVRKLIQELDDTWNSTSNNSPERKVKILFLENRIQDLKKRVIECQGGPAWDKLLKDAEELSSKTNVKTFEGRFILFFLLAGAIFFLGLGRYLPGLVGGASMFVGLLIAGFTVFLLIDAWATGNGIGIPDFSRVVKNNNFALLFPLFWIGIGLLMAEKGKLNLFAVAGWLLLGAGFWSCGALKSVPSTAKTLEYITDRTHCGVASVVPGDRMFILMAAGDDWREIEANPNFLDKKMAEGCSADLKFIPYIPEHLPQDQWWVVSANLYLPKGCTLAAGRETHNVQFIYHDGRRIEVQWGREGKIVPTQLKPGLPIRLDTRDSKGRVLGPVSASVICSS